MMTADTPLDLEGLAPIVGLRIREARTDKAMSQKDLVGERFSKSYISSIERGKITPSLKALEFIARQLDVSVSYLLTGVHPDPSASNAVVSAHQDDAGDQETPARWELLLAEVRLLREQHHPDQARLVLHNRVRVRQLSIEQLKQYHFVLAQLYLDVSDLAEAQVELAQVRELAEKTNDVEMLARVRHLTGLIFGRQNKPVQAIEQLRQALQVIESGVVPDVHLRLAIYNHLAALHHQLGDANEAARIYRQALQLAEEMSHPQRLAELYWSLAQSQRDLGQLNQARLWANKSLALYESVADRRLLSELRSGFGIIMLETQNLEEAEKQFLQARQIASEQNDTQAITVASMHLADLYLERGDLVQAERYSAETQAGFELLSPVAQGQILNSQAALLAAKGDNTSALKLYQQAITLVEPTPAKELLSKIYFRYARALSATGNTAQAAEMFEQAYRQLGRSSFITDR